MALPASANGAFTDDDDSIHEADIDLIADLGITKGCNPPVNDEYCPDGYITRAQMATFMRRAFDLAAGTPDRFIDDDDSVHEADIDAIAEAGITLGCNPPTNDRYCPDDYITRAQMASFILRGLGDVKSFNAPIFDDAPRGATHTADINALAGLTITHGCNPPTFTLYCPTRFMTRAEMASFLAKMIRVGDARPPSVDITVPDHQSTFVTELDADTSTYAVDVTFAASATDPDGGALVAYRWDSSVGGSIGTGNPITVRLVIPQGQTSSQPYISVVVEDRTEPVGIPGLYTGLFSGSEIQVKLIIP